MLHDDILFLSLINALTFIINGRILGSKHLFGSMVGRDGKDGFSLLILPTPPIHFPPTQGCKLKFSC